MWFLAKVREAETSKKKTWGILRRRARKEAKPGVRGGYPWLGTFFRIFFYYDVHMSCTMSMVGSWLDGRSRFSPSLRCAIEGRCVWAVASTCLVCPSISALLGPKMAEGEEEEWPRTSIGQRWPALASTNQNISAARKEPPPPPRVGARQTHPSGLGFKFNWCDVPSLFNV